MIHTAADEAERREMEVVPSRELRFAVLAWQTWAPRALAEKDAEIEALRRELRRVREQLEAAEIRLGERPRKRVTRLKVAAAHA